VSRAFVYLYQEEPMKQQLTQQTRIAYTPRHARPELFGACQIEGTPPDAAA